MTGPNTRHSTLDSGKSVTRQAGMEEVKIWAIQDESNASELARTGVDSELLLEDILVRNPHMLIRGLRLVGRQTPTEGGPLDLLGVGEDGRLVVFELKRGTLTRDAVAQVIDYASDLDAMGLQGVTQHIEDRSGKPGIEKIENFQEWYDAGDFGDLEGLLPPRMVLVGLGADARTERMVNFLAKNSNLDIALLTFHGFSYEGKTLLTKQVKVERRGTSGKIVPSDEELHRDLLERAERHGISQLYGDVSRMLEDNWSFAIRLPKKAGLAFRMRSSTSKGRYTYARVSPENGRVRLVLFRRAIKLWGDQFDKAVESISYVTWPKGLDPFDDETPEVQFFLTPENWDDHKELLTDMAKMVNEALEEYNSDDTEP